MLSDASDLLRRLRDHGTDLRMLNGRLRVTAPEGHLTDELKRQLVELKPQLLALMTAAVELLNRRGAQLIQNGKRMVIGLWRDADDREVREALDMAGLGQAEVLYLDDPESDIPDQYRQSAPEYVRTIWAKQGLLASPAERLKAEAKARYLNRLFDTLGTAPGRSHITAATVLHGMLAAKKKPGLR